MPKSTKDIDIGKTLKGCALGFPGSGKDVGLCSFPGKIMIFDVDGRINSIKKMHPGRDNIFYEQYKPGDYELLERDLNIYTKDTSYKMYILSSITTVGDMLIKYSMKLRGRDGMKKGIIPLSEVEDYLAESNGFSKIFDFLFSVEHAHVFVTAHVLKWSSFDITEQKEIFFSTVLTAGKKVAARIPTFFDEVWGFQAHPGIVAGSPGQYFVVTTPNSDIPSIKTTLPLPPKIEFTMPKFNLWDQIMASLKK